MPSLHLTGDQVADTLLSNDPNALLIAMVLDQQVPMEKAFSGPAVIAERMGGRLDVAAIAAMVPEDFAALCTRPPAVHRFPASMAGRIQAVCRALVDSYRGDAGELFRTAADGAALRARIAALPGFGAAKSQILTALLGKQYGVAPPGWREAAGPYGAAGSLMSVADIVDEQTLQQVRAAKKAAKATAKAGATPGGSRR